MTSDGDQGADQQHGNAGGDDSAPAGQQHPGNAQAGAGGEHTDAWEAVKPDENAEVRQQERGQGRQDPVGYPVGTAKPGCQVLRFLVQVVLSAFVAACLLIGLALYVVPW